MLTRGEARASIKLLLAFTIVTTLSATSAAIYMFVCNYIGFNSVSDPTPICSSSYLTYKYHTSKFWVYGFSFVGVIVGTLVGLTLSIVLLVLFWRHLRYDQGDDVQFIPWNIKMMVFLYLSFSWGLLSFSIPIGYFVSFVVQIGIYCTGTILLEWIIIGGLLLTALVSFLISWIYHLRLSLKFMNRGQINIQKIGKDEKYKDDKQIDKKQIDKKQQVEQVVNHQNRLKDMVKQLEIVKEQNRLHQLQFQKQIHKNDIKKPLLESSSEDQVIIEDLGQLVIEQFTPRREKLEVIDFEDYKRQKKEEQMQEKKKYYEQKMNIERQMEDMRINKAYQLDPGYMRKNNFSGMALSPNDANFDEIFKEDQPDKKSIHPILQENKEQNSKKKKYPVNYVPVDEQDRLEFQAQKKKEREEERKRALGTIDRIKRHPQNISYGRSKRAINKFLHANRRPERSEQTYFGDKPAIKQQNFFSFSDVDDRVKKIQQVKEVPKLQEKVSQSFGRKQKARVFAEGLYFQKKKVIERQKRDMLFAEQRSFLEQNSFGSILGKFNNGKVPTERESSQYSKIARQLKYDRQQRKNRPRKNERLIDYIRSKGAM